MRLKTVVLFVTLLLFFNRSFSQTQIKSHDIGKLWETMFATGSLPNYSPLQYQMCYPGGDFRLQTYKNQARLGLWIGVSNWTDKFGTFYSQFVAEGGYMNDEATSFLFPYKNKKKSWDRMPIVDVNGNIETRFLARRSSAIKSSTIPANEQIQTTWGSSVGVKVTMTSWALANENHNSYIIREYTFTNDGMVRDTVQDGGIKPLLDGQDLTGVYFGIQLYLLPGGDRGHQIVGQHDDWAAYYGNQSGDTLRGLFYVFDGNSNRGVYENMNDIGDPDPYTGEFLSPQYPAWGVLHADAAYDDESDDTSQPSTVLIQPEKNFRSTTKGDPYSALYAHLSSGQQDHGTVGQAPNAYDPTVQTPIGMLSFGPYDIPFGEDVKIVVYEAVGSISKALAISKGADWIDGDLTFEGKTGDEAKNALIATGKDSLFMHASRAEYAWNIGLKNLPTPPPSPNLTLKSGPGKIEISWESVADKKDKQTGQVGDFAGYRVYRAEDSYLNVYNKIYEVYGDTTHYTDRDVSRGKHYYYYVTAFDDGSFNTTGIRPGQKLESSPYYNRNFDKGGVVPFIGARNDMDSIYVVPNPYHLQGLAFGGTPQDDYTDVPRPEDKLAFVGLPAFATIRIFTMSGDLVVTLQHPNPDNPNSVAESADESWYQISESWQTIKSGVYIYSIEGFDLDGKPLGVTTGKFVIIR